MIIWQRSHDAETESLVRTASEMEYLPEACTKRLTALLDEILALLFTLIRRLNGANRT